MPCGPQWCSKEAITQPPDPIAPVGLRGGAGAVANRQRQSAALAADLKLHAKADI